MKFGRQGWKEMGDGQNMEKSADDDDMTKSHQQSTSHFICRLRLATNCSILLTRLFHLSHHTVSLDIDAAEEPEPGAHANRELLGCKLNVE